MKPDRIRREFQRLSRVRVSDGLLEQARRLPPSPPTPPKQRLFVTFVALSVFAAAGIITWSAFRPGSLAPQPPGDDGPSPTIMQLDCGDQRTDVLTPAVQVQDDGVVIHVADRGDAIGVEGSLVDQDPDSGTWAFDFGEGTQGAGFDITLAIEPGQYVVRCAHGDFLLGDLPTAGGETLRVVDPEGIWHNPALACAESEHRSQDFFGGELSVNPSSIIHQVVRHAIPGIADSDGIDYAEYPESPRGEEWHYRVTRGGEALARLRTLEAGNDREIQVEACSASGIGDPSGQTIGPIATAYELPDFPRCDPYTSDCTSLWMSEAKYAQLRGEEVPQPDPEFPSCKDAGADEACSVYPDDMPLQVLVLPGDGAAFVADHGCGATPEEMCRLEN